MNEMINWHNKSKHCPTFIVRLISIKGGFVMFYTIEDLVLQSKNYASIAEMMIAPKIPVSMVLIPAIIFRPVPAALSEMSVV